MDNEEPEGYLGFKPTPAQLLTISRIKHASESMGLGQFTFTLPDETGTVMLMAESKSGDSIGRFLLHANGHYHLEVKLFEPNAIWREIV